MKQEILQVFYKKLVIRWPNVSKKLCVCAVLKTFKAKCKVIIAECVVEPFVLVQFNIN